MIEEQAARNGCGCKAFPYERERRDEEGRLIAIKGGVDIHYCPLHAKAGEMREVLEGLLEELHNVLFSGGRMVGKAYLFDKCVAAQALLKETDNG